MILFLDIDGVLHPAEGKSKDDLFCRLPLLHEILRAAPHVEVVFSTDWRHSTPLKQLRRRVCEGARDLSPRFIGVTPKRPLGIGLQIRADECRAWLKANGAESRAWLALDDRPAFFYPGDNLYVVDGRTGLSAADVQAVIERLTPTPECDHDWLIEGQTMGGNVRVCTKCREVSVSG